MATYGWGTNEPIIAPEAEGGENIGTVCVKIKSAIADTFTKLNSETWADASTTASGYMSASDKIKLNGIETGAEVNQFAFSNISVAGTTISADTKQDTLTLVAGTGITLTPDAGNDKVTISFASDANVNSATKLATGRTFRTNLASTSTASFDGTANVAPGVTGILPVANGGTGNASGNAASATKLVTARAINGVNFNGTANISINSCPGTFTVGTAVDGTGEGGEIVLSRGASGPQIVIDNNLGTLRAFHNIPGPPIVAQLNLSGLGGWNCNAPIPTTSAGVGQITSKGVSQTFTLPAGGAWEVWGDIHNSNSTSTGAYYNIVAGGTTVNAGDAGTRTNWFAKRIG